MRGIEGSVAVVTGAGRGIGRAIAHRLAAEGARVALCDVDADGCRRVAGEIGARAIAVVADLALAGEAEAAVGAAIDRWGRVDALVNNAALLAVRPVLELPVEEWRRTLDVNLTAPFVMAQAAARDMAARGSGVIVNILAIQAESPLPDRTAYVSSKGGLEALTRSLAVDLSPLGIRVNAVQAGSIATEGVREQLGALGGTHGQGSATLLGRLGSPEEVAAAVAFLVSSESSFITGAVLRVDGGRLISRRSDPFLPPERR